MIKMVTLRKIIRAPVIAMLFIMLTINTNAQSHDLLGKTELQVLGHSKDFRIVEKQADDVDGSILFLEHSNQKTKKLIYFNTLKSSYKVVTIAPKEFAKEFKSNIDKNFSQLDANTWRTLPLDGSVFEIELREADDEVVFSVSKILLVNIDDKKIMPANR